MDTEGEWRDLQMPKVAGKSFHWTPSQKCGIEIRSVMGVQITQLDALGVEIRINVCAWL